MARVRFSSGLIQQPGAIWGFPKMGDPKKSTLNGRVLIKKPQDKVPLIFGNSHLLEHTSRALGGGRRTP